MPTHLTAPSERVSLRSFLGLLVFLCKSPPRVINAVRSTFTDRMLYCDIRNYFRLFLRLWRNFWRNAWADCGPSIKAFARAIPGALWRAMKASPLLALALIPGTYYAIKHIPDAVRWMRETWSLLCHWWQLNGEDLREAFRYDCWCIWQEIQDGAWFIIDGLMDLGNWMTGEFANLGKEWDEFATDITWGNILHFSGRVLGIFKTWEDLPAALVIGNRYYYDPKKAVPAG